MVIRISRVSLRNIDTRLVVLSNMHRDVAILLLRKNLRLSLLSAFQILLLLNVSDILIVNPERVAVRRLSGVAREEHA